MYTYIYIYIYIYIRRHPAQPARHLDSEKGAQQLCRHISNSRLVKSPTRRRVND